MDNILVKKKIQTILYHHIFLMMLLILISFCHILFISKFKIILFPLAILFYLCASIYILKIIFLLQPIYYILSKRIYPTIVKKIKNRVLFILSISILNGLCLAYAHWTNYLKLPKYIEECPYNFNLYDIKKLFNDFSEINSDYNEKCKYRRCFLDSNVSQNNKKNKEANTYNYICNYNHDYSDELKNSHVACNYINSFIPYENYDEVFYEYLKYCNDYTSFYICEHKYKIKTNLYLSYKDKCSKNYNKKNYEIIGTLFTIIDIIGVSSIWFTTFLEYSKILKLLNITINLETGNRISPSSLNSTKDISVIIQNGITNDININNYQTNIQQTETLFYPDSNRIFAEKKINNTRNLSMSNDINHDDSNLNSKNELIHFKPEKIC